MSPYQQEAVDATLAWFRRHTEPAAIVLPTGAGKSLVIAELARLARGRVLVLAGQHQHAAARQPGKLGDHQTFARAGGQDNRRRLGMATEPGEGGIDGFLLVRTQGKRFMAYYSPVN